MQGAAAGFRAAQEERKEGRMGERNKAGASVVAVMRCDAGMLCRSLTLLAHMVRWDMGVKLLVSA